MKPVELRTDRLVLTTPTPADADTITELCQDPEIQRWTTVPSPYERDDAVGFTESVARGWNEVSAVVWAVRTARDAPVLGMVGLHDLDDGEAELGYWLGRQHRGSGIMAEAAGAACDFGFHQLDLQRITWHAFVTNIASAAVARSLGFRFEGTVRLGASQRGRRRDEWQAGLLADDPRYRSGTWPAETFGSTGATQRETAR